MMTASLSSLSLVMDVSAEGSICRGSVQAAFCHLTWVMYETWLLFQWVFLYSSCMLRFSVWKSLSWWQSLVLESASALLFMVHLTTAWLSVVQLPDLSLIASFLCCFSEFYACPMKCWKKVGYTNSSSQDLKILRVSVSATHFVKCCFLKKMQGTFSVSDSHKQRKNIL